MLMVLKRTSTLLVDGKAHLHDRDMYFSELIADFLHHKGERMEINGPLEKLYLSQMTTPNFYTYQEYVG